MPMKFNPITGELNIVEPGPPGPNQITTGTDATIIGLIKGAAGKAAQAQPGQDYLRSAPGSGKFKVMNIFVNELGKVVVEYDDNPAP